MIAVQEKKSIDRCNDRKNKAVTRTVFDYIGSPEFLTDEDHLKQESAQLLDVINSKALGISSSPYSYSHGMGDLPVLSRDEESRCFRSMNFLKHQTTALQEDIRRCRSNVFHLARSAELADQIRTIRDFLIHSNLRLVIALVKKFVTPNLTFEELYSEGVLTLMQAVEKFDFQRGFRFSTYAYRSISRALYNYSLKSQQQNTMFVEDPESFIAQTADGKESSNVASQLWRNMRERLCDLIQRLDRREQLIIRARYALSPSGKIRTFQALADKLGISKERVRQLEQRAVAKLQKLAIELELAG